MQYSLEIQLLHIDNTYLYGLIDVVIYITPPHDFISEIPPEDTLESYFGLQIQKILYGLKQIGRMWYKHLWDFLLYC